MSLSNISGYSSTNPLARFQQASRTLAANAPVAAPTGSVADELILSDAAEAAAAEAEKNNMRLFSPFPARADGAVHVEDVRSFTQGQLADFQAKFEQLLAERGIASSAPVSLQTDAAGHVRVVGDHPQKDEIEQLFVEDPALRNEFAHVTANIAFLRAADEATEFQQAYREDPQVAEAMYAHLFNPNRKQPPIQVTLSGGEMTVNADVFPGSN